MNLIENPVLAIDFSEPSKIAAQAAFEMLKLAGAEKLTLLHAVQPVVLPAGNQPKVREHCEALRKKIHGAAVSQLEAWCEELQTPGSVKVQYEIVEGKPMHVVPEAAIRLNASLLMLGTHSRTGVRRWLKGSVSENILERTTVPTFLFLTGDDGVNPDAEIGNLKHVLVAVDMEEGSENVAAAGLKVAQSVLTREAPDTLLLNVAYLPDVSHIDGAADSAGAVRDELHRLGRRALDEYAIQFREAGLPVSVRVEDGEDVAERINAVAKEIDAQMMVIGTHGRGGAALLDIGSTLMHLVRTADISILVVPTRDRTE